MLNFKEEIAKLIAQQVEGLELAEIQDMIEVPQDHKMGDYAFPCFKLAKTLRKAPPLIAKGIAEGMADADLYLPGAGGGPGASGVPMGNAGRDGSPGPAHRDEAGQGDRGGLDAGEKRNMTKTREKQRKTEKIEEYHQNTRDSAKQKTCITGEKAL